MSFFHREVTDSPTIPHSKSNRLKSYHYRMRHRANGYGPVKIFFLLLSLLLPATASHAGETLTFGIVPQQSASKLARLWGPILQHISDRTGVTLQFATAPDIPSFEKRLSSGVYDLAYMNPYHYTVFRKSPGYLPLAKARDNRIKGIIVVRKDSGLRDLTELNDNTLAFPSPTAFAASILTRSHLSRLGVNYTPRYVSSHDSVYRAVAKGIFPAGGGVVPTFNNLAPDVREELKILWTTEGYTPHAVTVHQRLKKSTAEKIKQALIALEQSPDGKRLLRGIRIKGFESAADQDWDDIRKLNLKLLSDL